VLAPQSSYSRSDKAHNTMMGAVKAAGEILRNRGEQPRQKQNRLVFLAADYEAKSRLWEQARTYLAWTSILDDFKADRMVYQSNQMAEVKRAVEAAEQGLKQLLREAYKWLLCPLEEFKRGKPVLDWEAVTVSPAAPGLVQAIEQKLREEEWLITEWSPIHLKQLLGQWYFKDDKTEVSAIKVYQDCCHYLYLPRLADDQVLRDAISTGLETEDFFGFASGKDEDKYLGFAFGRSTMIQLDEPALLIERGSAAAYKERTRLVPVPGPVPGSTAGEYNTGGASTSTGISAGTGASTGSGGTSTAVTIKNRFYGTVNLEPVKAKMDFATIVDEVVQQFTAKIGVNVTISVEINAQVPDGFDEALQRTVKENCNVLRFTSAEFEELE
jgi:hypothetical protein